MSEISFDTLEQFIDDYFENDPNCEKHAVLNITVGNEQEISISKNENEYCVSTIDFKKKSVTDEVLKDKKEILSFIKQKDDKTKIWYEAYGSNETGTFWEDLTFDNELDRELFR